MLGQFHHQLFSCRSDFEEARPRSSFLFKSYNSCEVCVSRLFLQDDMFINIFDKCFCFKIAAPGEERKPNRKAYVVESEFAFLSILSKILIIHFYIGSSDQLTDGSRNNKRSIFQTLVMKRCIARMFKDSLTQPCIYHSDLSKHSWKLLKLQLLCIVLMLRH